MIKSQHRLPSSIEKIYGTSIKSQCCKLIYKPNHQTHSRFRIIISKKNVRLATHRNKLRRQISHILPTTFPSGFDCILVIYPPGASYTHTQLHSQLSKLASQVES